MSSATRVPAAWIDSNGTPGIKSAHRTLIWERSCCCSKGSCRREAPSGSDPLTEIPSSPPSTTCKPRAGATAHAPAGFQLQKRRAEDAVAHREARYGRRLVEVDDDAHAMLAIHGTFDGAFDVAPKNPLVPGLAPVLLDANGLESFRRPDSLARTGAAGSNVKGHLIGDTDSPAQHLVHAEVRLAAQRRASDDASSWAAGHRPDDAHVPIPVPELLYAKRSCH
eukprot:scaffold3719_cov247-Pinguiococcus_pyrenoidosus.AAC.2